MMVPTEVVSSSSRLIVALDVDTQVEAMEIVDDLHGLEVMYKIGLQLFVTGELRNLLRKLSDLGVGVFLDYKMHDIDETISATVRNITRYGNVEFLTLHGNGATTQAAKEGRGDKRKPRLLSIPLLSSLDEEDLIAEGFVSPERFQTMDDYVLRKARTALENGADGLIASGDTIRLIRKAHPNAVIVSPGIRPSGIGRDDHKRVMTPSDAIMAGADHIVVGRPIRNATKRKDVAQKILDEIGEASTHRNGTT
jgi:orotidine-5'-phosphate decarboxylase